jgi:hypothetical protein
MMAAVHSTEQRVRVNRVRARHLATARRKRLRSGNVLQSMSVRSSRSLHRTVRHKQLMTLLNPLQQLGLMGVKNPLGGPPAIPPEANQTNPRQWYVYAHMDETGSIFYVGKGTGRRAWSDSGRARHEHWYWYVEKHLRGKYSVQILVDDLDEDKALLYEDAWMSYLDPDRLINWANYYRTNAGDQERYAKATTLREETKQLIERAAAWEKTNAQRAIDSYLKALRSIDRYAPSFHAQRPTGLIGMISDEIARSTGREDLMKGDVIVIDRLTLCLKKLGRGEEAAKHADQYFAKYPYDARLKQGIAVQKRVNKLVGRKDPTSYPTWDIAPEDI